MDKNRTQRARDRQRETQENKKDEKKGLLDMNFENVATGKNYNCKLRAKGFLTRQHVASFPPFEHKCSVHIL